MRKTDWHKKFKEFLKQEGITKKDASIKTNIPYTTLCAYLNGSRTPSDKNKEVIRKSLKFDIYTAMYGDFNDKD